MIVIKLNSFVLYINLLTISNVKLLNLNYFFKIQSFNNTTWCQFDQKKKKHFI